MSRYKQSRKEYKQAFYMHSVTAFAKGGGPAIGQLAIEVGKLWLAR